MSPQNPLAGYRLGRLFLVQRRFQESLAEMEKIPEHIYRPHGLALVYRALGRSKEAEAALSELIRNYGDTGAYQVAQVHAHWGQADQALEWLERAYRQRDSGLTQMKFDRLLKPIANDRRFHAFLKKMKLAQSK